MKKFLLSEKPVSLINVFFQTAALSAFALAQPVAHLVSQNPDFLTVHHSGAVDVLILAAALFFGPPLALTALVYLVGLAHALLRQITLVLVLVGLMLLILLPILDKLSFLDGWLVLVAAVFLVEWLVILYSRSPGLRQVLSGLVLALPVFLVLFLGSGSIRDLLFSPGAKIQQVGQGVTSPVVVLVFDEFPTTSLMSRDQELDCDLFPNFCRLAEISTWFPNATSISGATLRSVPAILSGKFPGWKAASTHEVYPENIFTLLGTTHRVLSLESQTSLCPPELKSEPIPRLGPRLELLASDLSVLYQHVVVPLELREHLIPVSDKWGNYRETGHTPDKKVRHRTKVEVMEDFFASIEDGSQPVLAVAHVLLPHTPYRFFPEGTIYTRREKTPILSDGTWGPDATKKAHSFRRHLLQVATVDRLLGDLLDQLEDQGMLETAAIVVTADHGVSFRTGHDRRRYSPGSVSDIMGVPLFIKHPGQNSGQVDSRFAQTTDIMPSLVASLGAHPGWEFDGVDLWSDGYEKRTELDFLDQDARVHHKISPSVLEDRNETLAWKHELIGRTGGLDRLFGLGDEYGLRGTRTRGIEKTGDDRLQGQIHNAPVLLNVDLNASFVPAEINGTLDGFEGPGNPTLALALNGIIAGVSPSYLADPESNTHEFGFLVSLESLKQGFNECELFLVKGPSPESDLVRVWLEKSSFLGANLGGKAADGVREKGLFRSHNWDGRPVRWTNGQGEWEIPLQEGEQPKNLTLEIVSCGPSGNQVTVVVNGRQILDEKLPRGAWETTLALEGIDQKEVLKVELKSATFIPSERNSQSTDSRSLGLAVAVLRVE